MSRLPWLAVTFVLLATGCAHHRLAHDHVQQARTLTTINEQQVLDNLAMFMDNPNALPYFAIPGAGSAVVTDDGGIDLSTINGPGRSVLGPLDFNRNNRLTWATKPVTDPNRLLRMKCAYRRAIGLCDASDCCVNCSELLGHEAYDCCGIRRLKIERCSTPWVPGRRWEKIGRSNGTRIRVCPESYADFNRLVMKVMDFAVNDFTASKPTMQVQRLFYDEVRGRLTKIETYDTDILSEEDAKKQKDAADGDDDHPSRLDREGSPVQISPRRLAPVGLDQIQELQILRDSVFPTP